MYIVNSVTKMSHIRHLKIDVTNYIVLWLILCGIQCSTELANHFQLSPLKGKRSSSEEPDGDRRQWRPRHPLRLCRFHRTNLSHSNALTLCFTPLRRTTTNPFSLSVRIWGARSKASRATAAGQSSVSPTWAKTPPLSPIPTPTLLLHWFLSPLSLLLPNSPPKMPKRLSFSSAPRPRPSPRKSPPSAKPSSSATSLGGSSLFAHVAFLVMHDASFAPLSVFFGFEPMWWFVFVFRLLWVTHFGELLYCAGIDVKIMQCRNLEVPITVILSRLCIPSASSAPFS